jgi:hypothetical protein
VATPAHLKAEPLVSAAPVDSVNVVSEVLVACVVAVALDVFEQLSVNGFASAGDGVIASNAPTSEKAMTTAALRRSSRRRLTPNLRTRSRTRTSYPLQNPADASINRYYIPNLEHCYRFCLG